MTRTPWLAHGGAGCRPERWKEQYPWIGTFVLKARSRTFSASGTCVSSYYSESAVWRSLSIMGRRRQNSLGTPLLLRIFPSFVRTTPVRFLRAGGTPALVDRLTESLSTIFTSRTARLASFCAVTRRSRPMGALSKATASSWICETAASSPIHDTF